MSQPQTTPILDRYTTMGDLTRNARRALGRSLLPASGLLVLSVAWLGWRQSPGLTAFILMAAGALVSLRVWQGAAIGVPIMPLFITQQLVVIGMPIVSGHEVLGEYPESLITSAGLDALVFSLAITGGWKIGMNSFRPAPPTAFALVGFDQAGMAGLTRLGFWLVGSASLYLLATSAGLLDGLLALLPAGSYPILGAATAAASACGFFVLAMLDGALSLSSTARIVFWVLLVANCLISASSLLLSAAAVVLAAAAIGLFWSRGRLPWKFVLIAAVVVSFLNSGKYEMRARYWPNGDNEQAARTVTFTELPAFFSEWTTSSWSAITTPSETSHLTSFSHRTGKKQGLLQRLNNLQNSLYVLDAIEIAKIPPLNGATYAVIPPLLIPRILWPNKPRSHEGQIMLNVHFGRQLLESTYVTYIAWGLLAEAEGNFGSIKGALLVGLALGVFFAWCENYTARKPLLSTEGFVFFAIFLGIAGSYEMVSSVLITSIFQSIVPIVAASMPFVQRRVLVRPEP